MRDGQCRQHQTTVLQCTSFGYRVLGEVPDQTLPPPPVGEPYSLDLVTFDAIEARLLVHFLVTAGRFLPEGTWHGADRENVPSQALAPHRRDPAATLLRRQSDYERQGHHRERREP